MFSSQSQILLDVFVILLFSSSQEIIYIVLYLIVAYTFQNKLVKLLVREHLYF